jgi:predicted permease
MPDARAPWFLSIIARLLPSRYRAEILDDLIDEYAATLQTGRSRGAANIWLVAHVVRSAAASRRLNPGIGHGPLFRGGGQDLRYAWRRLRRTPGISLLAVLTLALGIGSSAAMFSLVNAALLKTAAVPDIDRVVALRYAEARDDGVPTLSYPDFHSVSSAGHPFSGVAAVLHHGSSVTANGGGQGEPVQVEMISSSYFDVLRQKPLLGSLSLPDDERRPTFSVILGERVWRRWFGGDRSVIGKTITVSRVPLTIVGVVPATFAGVRAPTIRRADLWLPLSLFGRLGTPTFDFPWDDPRRPMLTVFGRLRDDVSEHQARSAVGSIERRSPREASTPAFSFTPAREVLVFPGLKRALMPLGAGFTALAMLVLVIACSNLANLFLAQSLGRRHEFAVRRATGAGRWRLIRLVTIESLFLTFASLVIGLGLGSAVSHALAATALPPFDGNALQVDPTLDWRVVGFSTTLAILAALIVSVGPAWHAARSQPGILMSQAPPIGGGGRRLRAVLVSAQVAGSTVLLIVAGLYVRSAVSALRHDAGFDVAHAAMVRLDLGFGADLGRADRFLNRALAEAHQLAGVRHVALADVLPLGEVNDGVKLVGDTPSGENRPEMTGKFARVSPKYLDALHIPLKRGRPFADTDDAKAPPVAIVSEAVARMLWPGQDPLGKRIALGDANIWQEVVGVSGDTDVGMPGNRGGLLLLPISQRPVAKPMVIVQSPRAPDTLVEPLRQVIRSLDPDVAVVTAGTVAEDLAILTLPIRAVASIVTALGVIGLLLAMLGLYGTMTYTVKARTKEIGIRVALGARATEVRWLVLGQSLRILVAGVVPGVVLAYLGTGWVRHLLFGVEPHDLPTFLAIPFLLVLVGIVATYFPGRRATRIDPTVALREL